LKTFFFLDVEFLGVAVARGVFSKNKWPYQIVAIAPTHQPLIMLCCERYGKILVQASEAKQKWELYIKC